MMDCTQQSARSKPVPHTGDRSQPTQTAGPDASDVVVPNQDTEASNDGQFRSAPAQGQQMVARFVEKAAEYVTGRSPSTNGKGNTPNEPRESREQKTQITVNPQQFRNVNGPQPKQRIVQLPQQRYDQLLHNYSLLEKRVQEADTKARADSVTIQQLRKEVMHYKSNISVATRTPDQMTDETIKIMVDDVFHAMQNFVVRFFRGSSFGMSSLNPSAFDTNLALEYNMLPEDVKLWMDEYMPYTHSSRKKDWINIAIGVISKILTNYSDQKYFFGCSDNSTILAAVDLGKLLQCK
jgi:hypothetical protein